MRLPLLFITCISLAACSDVSLTYRLATLPNTQGQSILEQTRTVQTPLTELANLSIQTRVQSDQNLTGLRLRFILKSESQTLQEIEVDAESFLENPDLFWQDLPPGPALLEVELLNTEKQVLGKLNTSLVLTSDGKQQADFALLPGSLFLGLPGRAPQQSSFLNVSPALAETPQVPSLTPTTSNAVQGSVNETPIDLKLRLIEAGQDYLLFIWEKPLNTDVDYYRIFLDGKEIKTNHEVANFRVSQLFNNKSYQFEVLPVLKNGTELKAQPVDASTGSGASSGGGGGGGGSSSGGGGTVAPNNPPVIQTFDTTTTTVTGLGYPVGLTAAATDELNLTDAAYSWSCADCLDANFSSATGKTVVWNAPTTPGAYTLTLSVSDGVNTPVTQTRTITVTQRQTNVIVEGRYR